eukprot:COSAG02_NODE_352_length_24036_cov_20.479258_17_plen_427_part_00
MNVDMEEETALLPSMGMAQTAAAAGGGAASSHADADADADVDHGRHDTHPAAGPLSADMALLSVDVLVRVQARVRGNRVRRAQRCEDMKLLYHQKTEGARKFLAEKTKALTKGLRPYVNVHHALSTQTVDKARGVEKVGVKSRLFIGKTHSCYLVDSESTAYFTHMRGRNLQTPPHNAFTFLIPLELSSDEQDELQLQIMSEEFGTDSFVGVAVLDLAQMRHQAAKWLAAGDHPTIHYRHEFSLWVKYAGRRQGSVDFALKLRRCHDHPHSGRPSAVPSPEHERLYEHGVVSDVRPEAWGERSVLACTLTVLRTCGLRDPNALSQPLFEITNAPHYENLFQAMLYIVLYLATGESLSHNHYCSHHNACFTGIIMLTLSIDVRVLTGECAFLRQAACSTLLCRARCIGETKTSASLRRSVMRSTSAW